MYLTRVTQDQEGVPVGMHRWDSCSAVLTGSVAPALGALPVLRLWGGGHRGPAVCARHHTGAICTPGEALLATGFLMTWAANRSRLDVHSIRGLALSLSRGPGPPPRVPFPGTPSLTPSVFLRGDRQFSYVDRKDLFYLL